MNSLSSRQHSLDGISKSVPSQPKFKKTAKRQSTAIWALSFYALSWVAVLWSGVCLPGLEDPMCFGLLAKKHEILDNSPSPKVVFVGGSNLLFGIDGIAMEKGLHRPVVNMGLCIMFPLPYLLEEVKDNVRKGDLIVLSPEYADFSDEYASNIAVADILDIYPRAIWWILRSNCLNQEQLQTLFGHVRSLGLKKLDYASRHMAQIVQHRCKWTHAKYDPNLEVMNTKNMDRCGGLTWHLKQKNDNRPSDVLFLVSQHLGTSQARVLNDFGDYCASRGARFVMIPPSVSTKQYGQLKGKVESIIRECKSLKVPLIASPERYTFPVTMIFNNQYHLNKTGRALRTQRMIEDLRPAVDDLSKKNP